MRQFVLELANLFRLTCYFCSAWKKWGRPCREWDTSNEEGTESGMPPLNPNRRRERTDAIPQP